MKAQRSIEARVWSGSGRGLAVFVGATGWGSAVSGRSSGWETLVVVRRAAGCFGALVGGLAGIAPDVAENARVLGAILGSPYPDTSLAGTSMADHALGWHLASPPRSSLAPRRRTTLVSG
jgi:hypothetical protein